MQQFIDQLYATLGSSVPKLLAALGILVAGWLVALVVSALIRAGLKRTTIDNRLASWFMGDDKEAKVEIEQWISRAAFYLVMLLVFVAFFQALGLTLITQPINQLLNSLFEYGPQLLGAALLVMVAWMIATALRFIVSRAMTAAKFEERVGDQAGIEDDKRIPLTKTVSESVYWLVYLLFLPAVLNTLRLEGLLEPVQGMINQVLGFLPNLLAAVLILFVGWFAGRIIQRIITNLLAAVGTDSLSERVGLTSVLGEKKLSWFLGFVVYILILVPVVVASLNALKLDYITQPASSMLSRILDALPHIFAAVLILALAYVVGRVVARICADLLAGVGFNSVLVKMGITQEIPEGKQRPSEIVAYLVLVAVLMFASVEAAGQLGFASFAELLKEFMKWCGNVVLGLIVFGVGLFLAGVASKAVSASETHQARLLALAARISIIVLAGTMALNHMKVGQEIIELAFGIILAAVGVAWAIAFGMGGREIAARELETWVNSVKSPKGDTPAESAGSGD